MISFNEVSKTFVQLIHSCFVLYDFLFIAETFGYNFSELPNN